MQKHPSDWRPPACWHPAATHWRLTPPAAWRSWLNEPGSLTARLQRKALGGLRVRVLHEGWAVPHLEERRQLGLKAGQYAWVREVQLLNGDAVWVQARSILPRSSLTGMGRRLTRLGNQSLGSVLFRNPALVRGDIACARVTLANGICWARRSRLTLHGHPVLVAEAFMPALLD
ncbi:MAG: chorismate lyase [Pseudomonadota bacterium]